MQEWKEEQRQKRSRRIEWERMRRKKEGRNKKTQMGEGSQQKEAGRRGGKEGKERR